MARKFSDELKQHAVRLALEHQTIHTCSPWAASQEIGSKLGISPNSVLRWMKQIDPSPTSDDSSAIDYVAENARLRTENRQLHQENRLLEQVSAQLATVLTLRARK